MKVLYLFSHQIWFPPNKKIISPKCPHLFIQSDRLPLHFISFFQTMHSFPTKKKNYIQFLHQVMHSYPQKCKVFLSSINSRRSSHLQPLKKWIHTFIPPPKITRPLLFNLSCGCYFSYPYAFVRVCPSHMVRLWLELPGESCIVASIEYLIASPHD